MRTVPFTRQLVMTKAHFCNILDRKGSLLGVVIVKDQLENEQVVLE